MPSQSEYDDLLKKNKALEKKLAGLIQVEDELRRSERKFRDIFSNVSDFLYFHDLNGKFVEVNEHFKAAFGDIGEGLTVRDILVEKYKDLFSVYLDSVKKDNHAEGLMNVQTLDGRELILEYRNSLVFESSEPIGIRGSARDISAHIKAETMLRKSEIHLKELVDEKTREIQLTQRTSIQALATLAEYNDTDTGEHLNRIQRYVRLLATRLRVESPYSEYLGKKDTYIDELELASLLHDIGKVAIPKEILTKPGKLTSDEFDLIKEHTSIAGEMLEKANKIFMENYNRDSYLALARDIAFFHHEKWDGSGYPSGLKGESIPLSARIVAVADVYDALTSKRSYKNAWSHEDAVNEIIKGRGKHFDPVLVDIFQTVVNEFNEISAT